MTATSALHPRAPSRIVRESSSFAAIWPQRPFATPNWVSSICLYLLLVTDCFAAGCSQHPAVFFLADEPPPDLSMSSPLARQYHRVLFLGRRGSDGYCGQFYREFCVFSSVLLCALLSRYELRYITDFVINRRKRATSRKFS